MSSTPKTPQNIRPTSKSVSERVSFQSDVFTIKIIWLYCYKMTVGMTTGHCCNFPKDKTQHFGMKPSLKALHTEVRMNLWRSYKMKHTNSAAMRIRRCIGWGYDGYKGQDMATCSVQDSVAWQGSVQSVWIAKQNSDTVLECLGSF